jgi:hypothetical protein
MSKKFGYISVSRFPLELNGANIATMELLDYLRRRGNEASMTSFYTSVPFRRSGYGPDHDEGAREATRLETTFAGLLKGIEYREERLPQAVFDCPERYPSVVKKVFDVVKAAEINHTISHGNDFYGLIGTYMTGLPGSFFFHSVSGIRETLRYGLSLKLLRTRTVFSASAFLQSRARELLDIDTIVWYPVFNLRKRGQRRTDHVTRTIGYYSSGRYKGDVIIDRIMERRCEWRFIVLGRSHTRRSAVGPPNLHVWGATTDPMGFYDAIDLILVPSVVEEGFSRMVLEACANGIPVIANRVGGIPEAMGNGGVMIDVDLREELDLEDIADRYIDEIERLFTDEEYYQFMSKNALRRAEEYQEEQKRLSDANYSLYMS